MNRQIDTVAGVERFALDYGWNVIECDSCGCDQPLDRSHDKAQLYAEATDKGWSCGPARDDGRDLCPRCKS